MKNILAASFVFALLLTVFSACNNKPSEQTTAIAASGTKYICPMNCEKGKTYDQPGTCPVCNMNLEVMKAEVAGNSAEYFTAFVANPAQLEAGKPGMLSFTPKIKGNESAPVPLDLVHEKKMHLILVSDDLSWFDHIHPEYQASGAYEIKVLSKGESFTNGRGHNETRFDAGGKYWAFADYKPINALNQVNKMELNVAGTPAKTVAYAQPKMTTTVDGYKLTMEAGHGSSGFKTGSQQHIPVTITQGGKAVDPATFENYLGEKAHLVLVEVNSKAFVHTHPSVEDGKLDIHTTFSESGTYRGWLQFQTAGKVHTADFVLTVTVGKDEHQGHDHEHGEGDDHSGH
ncbi:MAG: heavy metal-binding domain-containing protein [Saprospiraceae bacterium]|nr:heavy metal-binding domain-containing protein [Saprospiraceae bacterium]